MHPSMPIKDINFEEMDSSMNWEYVMLDTFQFNHNNQNDEDNLDGDDGHRERLSKDADQNQLHEIA